MYLLKITYLLFKIILSTHIFYSQQLLSIMASLQYQNERIKAINRIKATLTSFKTYKQLTPSTTTTQLSEQLTARQIQRKQQEIKENVRRTILEKAKQKGVIGQDNKDNNGGINGEKKKKTRKPKQKIYLHCLSLHDVVKLFRQFCLTQNIAEISFFSAALKQKILQLKNQLEQQYPPHRAINQDYFIIHYLKNSLTSQIIQEDVFTPFDHRLIASIIFYWQRESYRQKYYKPEDPQTDKLWRKKYKINRQFSVPRQGGQVTFTQNLNPQKLKFYYSIYSRQTVSFYRKFLQFQVKNHRQKIGIFRQIFEQLYLPSHQDVLTQKQKSIIDKFRAKLNVNRAADHILNKLRTNQKDRKIQSQRKKQDKFYKRLQEKQKQKQAIVAAKKQKKALKQKQQISQNNHKNQQNPQKSENKQEKTDHASKQSSKQQDKHQTKARKLDIQMFCKQPVPVQVQDLDPVPIQYRREVDRRMNPYKGYSGYTSESRAKSEARLQKLLAKVIQEHVELAKSDEENSENRGDQQVSPISPLPDLESLGELQSYKGDIFQEQESEQ